MKKYITISIWSITVISIVAFTYQFLFDNDYSNRYKDRSEFPLKKINIYDESNYILVKKPFSGIAKIEVITDTQLLKENKNKVEIKNNGELYGTTPYGMLTLYKDGKQIDNCWFDNDPYYTYEQNYAGLEGKFTQINELTLLLMFEPNIIQQDKHFTVLVPKDDYNNYYTFVHSEDKTLLTDVIRVDVTEKPMQISYIDNKTLELQNQLGANQIVYQYYNANTGKLDRGYSNIKARNGHVIVYAVSDSGQTSIIARKLFNETKKLAEFIGDFDKSKGDFWLISSARFVDINHIEVEYHSSDGSIKKTMLNLL